MTCVCNCSFQDKSHCVVPLRNPYLFIHVGRSHVHTVYSFLEMDLGTKSNPWLWNIRKKLYPRWINSIVLSTNGWLLCNYSLKCRLSINSKVPNLISGTTRYIPISNCFLFLQQQFCSTPFQRVWGSLSEVKLGCPQFPYYINDALSACTAGVIIKIPQMPGLVLPPVPSFPKCENGTKILPTEPALF